MKERKRRSYDEEEKKFQEAQARWEEDINDIEAWHEMFTLINLACFNNVNKKLEKLLPRDEIEGRAMDITLKVMAGIKRKRENGADWKVRKVSSYVHLPCLSIYDKKLQFWDRVLGQNAFINDEDNDEYSDDDFRYEYQQGHGLWEQERL